jgi:translation initiation factor 2 beta subunit (eIF-2beta)/eIF-5
VYALLKNKSKVTYTTALHQMKLRIRELGVNLLYLENIVRDFELAIINSQRRDSYHVTCFLCGLRYATIEVCFLC